MPDMDSQPNELEQLKAQLAASQAEAAALADAMLASVPEQLRALIPDDLTPTQKVNFARKAQVAAASFAKVPVTDTARPTVTPKGVDPTTLSPIARMAAGYTKR